MAPNKLEPNSTKTRSSHQNPLPFSKEAPAPQTPGPTQKDFYHLSKLSPFAAAAIFLGNGALKMGSEVLREAGPVLRLVVNNLAPAVVETGAAGGMTLLGLLGSAAAGGVLGWEGAKLSYQLTGPDYHGPYPQTSSPFLQEQMERYRLSLYHDDIPAQTLLSYSLRQMPQASSQDRDLVLQTVASLAADTRSISSSAASDERKDAPSQEEVDAAFAHAVAARAATVVPETSPIVSVDGTRIYKNPQLLADGGQATVYKVIGPDGKTYVAKESHNVFKTEADAAELLREITVLEKVQHPNLVSRVDHFLMPGERGGFKVVLVLEYVEGENLLQILKDKKKRPLSETDILEVARQIDAGLQALHAKHITHRDLSLSNVMFSRDGAGKIHVTLLDLGLAKLDQRTNTKSIGVGTPSSMAPEQWGSRDVPNKYRLKVGPWSDVFSLGTVLFDLAMGEDTGRLSPIDPKDSKTFPLKRYLSQLREKGFSAFFVKGLKGLLDLNPEVRMRAIAKLRKTEVQKNGDSVVQSAADAVADRQMAGAMDAAGIFGHVKPGDTLKLIIAGIIFMVAFGASISVARRMMQDSIFQKEPLPIEHREPPPEPPAHHEPVFGGGCFTGSTYVQESDGQPISFNDLVKIKSEGLPLPRLTSFDESTGKTLDQQPTVLLEHPNLTSSLMYLHVQNEQREEWNLEVTTNHRMLAKHHGEQKWIPAGKLETGDLLVTPDNQFYTVNREATQIVEGAFDVYNLSFSQPTTGQIPTYLVSPDGIHWMVAHNIKSSM